MSRPSTEINFTPDGALIGVAVVGGPAWTADRPTSVLDEGRYLMRTLGFRLRADRHFVGQARAEPLMASRAGDRLGHYKIGSLLGAGGTGEASGILRPL